MSKTLLMVFLAACMLAAAAPQAAHDAPGVTVALNGAAVLHRTGVNYPSAALRDGVQGTVSVQVKLDSTGTVNDAQVLSGPDELRKAVLESVLEWHFSRDAAGSTRVIQIAFELPKATATAVGTDQTRPSESAPGNPILLRRPANNVTAVTGLAASPDARTGQPLHHRQPPGTRSSPFENAGPG